MNGRQYFSWLAVKHAQRGFRDVNRLLRWPKWAVNLYYTKWNEEHFKLEKLKQNAPKVIQISKRRQKKAMQ